MKKQLIFILLLVVSGKFLGQEWMAQNPDEKNFYRIQSAFNEYWKGKDITQKGKGYKQFKRWEAYMEPRVYPSGDITLPSNTWHHYEEYLKSSANQASKIAVTTWTPMGPFGALSGTDNTGGPRKAGRYSFITFHPSIPSTFWCGSCSGGLWKTTDNGVSWTTNTDNLGVIGCTDLAVDPTNPNIMYLATGDGDAGYTNSIGVLTTTNGGASWAPTSLTFAVSAGVRLSRIILDPTNSQKIIVAASNGIYTSTNALTSYTQVGNVKTWDLEFCPLGTNTVYAGGGGSFSVSTNGGMSFVQVVAGIPTPANARLSIAVTTINPSYVYVLASTSNGTLNGVYRSMNSGANFSLMANTPNLLDDDCSNPNTNGQGWFDLAIAASPITPGEIVVGGINVWRSMNGGSTWTVIGCRNGYIPGNPAYIHADQHDLEYNNGILYSANDGGVCRYTGTAWNDITGNANIAHINRIGLSSLSPNLWVTGHVDNGSNVYNNGVYDAGMHSDGEDCFIDRTNDQMVYASYQNAGLHQSSDGGNTYTPCVSGNPGPGANPAPWKQDPVTATTFWVGTKRLYRSTLPGIILWQPCAGVMSGTNAAQFITDFAVSPANNQVVFAIHGTTGVFRSYNAGATWTLSNTGLPGGIAKTSIIAHPTNTAIAWVTCSGYSFGQKVYKTINGGVNWNPVPTVAPLPNIPVNCILYEPGNPNDRIYIGMDVGVYYIDNTMPSWVPYNTGLPNVIISELEISPAAPNKIRAATFGRGVYQVDIVPNAAPPVTAFNYVGNKCALTSTLYMNDNSSNSPTAWSWSVSPAAGVVINSPSAQNPTITFSNFGTYSISMIPSNGFGSGAVSVQTVSIFSPTLNAVTSTSIVCNGASFTGTASGANSYTWQPGNIIGANASYTPAFTVNYTVTGTAANGCTSWDTLTVYWDLCTIGTFHYGNELIKFKVYPSPVKDKLLIHMGANSEMDFTIELTDAIGKQITSEEVKFSKDQQDQMINTSELSSGIYLLNLRVHNGNKQTLKILKE